MEIYSLLAGRTEDGTGPGQEAIDTIMSNAYDGHNGGPLALFIFAGYRDKMEELKDANPGFRSRIQHDFDLEPYSPWDLKEIFNIMVKRSSEQLFLEDGLFQLLPCMFQQVPIPYRAQSNARLCERLLQKAVEEIRRVLPFRLESKEHKTLARRITKASVQAALEHEKSTAFKANLTGHDLTALGWVVLSSNGGGWIDGKRYSPEDAFEEALVRGETDRAFWGGVRS